MQLDLTNFKATQSQAEVVPTLDSEKVEPEITLIEPKSEVSNKFKFGQYFTKTKVVLKVLNLIQEFKSYPTNIKILEPSFGTKNFITVLKQNNFNNIIGCEIDPLLTDNPSDFFDFPIEEKFNLIIGNPPFTKYNVPESYYYPKNYINNKISPVTYLTKNLLKKEKEKIENIFILKSLKHLSNNSSIAFVLPISFFIKNRNKEIKKELLKEFSTVIIFQNNEVWFDYHIPCCFAIFTNNEKYKNKIILQFENGEVNREILDINKMNEELIPEVVFNKNNGVINNDNGVELNNFIIQKRVKCKKSFKENNVSAKNILEKTKIPLNKNVVNYKLAVVRVGNSSVGKCGLINVNEDVLNDMFYVFDFDDENNKNKELKEKICNEINKNQDYFKNVTCRVGSKSIKKEDVLNFKVEIEG
jgi:hypothetical protein